MSQSTTITCRIYSYNADSTLPLQGVDQTTSNEIGIFEAGPSLRLFGRPIQEFIREALNLPADQSVGSTNQAFLTISTFELHDVIEFYQYLSKIGQNLLDSTDANRTDADSNGAFFISPITDAELAYRTENESDYTGPEHIGYSVENPYEEVIQDQKGLSPSDEGQAPVSGSKISYRTS